MSQTAAPSSFPVNAIAIGQAHQLYCQLTGQSLRLAFDWERMWYQLLRLGYSLQDLRTVITYLQRMPCDLLPPASDCCLCSMPDSTAWAKASWEMVTGPVTSSGTL